MMQDYKKIQGTKTYRVPVIFMNHPDKETIKLVESILKDTTFTGEYRDRIVFFMNLEKAGLTGVIPMCAEQLTQEGFRGGN